MQIRRYTWMVLLASIAAAAGATLASMLREPQPLLGHGTWLPAPRLIAPFALQSTDGKRFDNASLRGPRPTIVFFGYTACPDICPTTLSIMSEVYRSRVADGLPDFQVLFVTVDPERDTAENLRQYLNAFSPEFLGARGSFAALAPLMSSLGVVVLNVPRTDGSYSMDHTASAFWVDQRGRYRAVFSAPISAKELRSDLRRIAAAHAI